MPEDSDIIKRVLNGDVDSIAPGDHLIAVKTSDRDADPQRGDLVLFTNPNNRREFWIKRVIALAGDTVAVRDGNLYVNGVKLARESSVPGAVSGATGNIFDEHNNGAKYRIFISPGHPVPDVPEIIVPKYECFVMSDNRSEVRDSRYFVTVRRSRLTLKGEGVAGWQGETTIITIPRATTPPHRQRES